MRDIRPDGTVLMEVTFAEGSPVSGIYDQFGPGGYPDGPWERQARVLPDGDWVTTGGRKADGSHWEQYDPAKQVLSQLGQ